MKKNPNYDSFQSSKSNSSSKKISSPIQESPIKKARYKSPPERINPLKKSSENTHGKMKVSSNFSTPLKTNNKETMNFEINYIDHLDIHDIESNKNYTPPSSELKKLNSDIKEPIYESPKSNDKEENEKNKPEVDENEQKIEENKNKEIPNIKGDRKLNFNPTYEQTSLEPNKNIFGSNNNQPPQDSKKSNFYFQKNDEDHDSVHKDQAHGSWNQTFQKKEAPLNLSDEIKKTEILTETPHIKNESFREQDSFKNQYLQNTSQFNIPNEFVMRPDFKDFNGKNSHLPNIPNFPNYPGFDMSYSMYIVNFYEFHLNNMQNIIIQKNEEIMTLSIKLKEMNETLSLTHLKYKELYMKNEYENDTFSKKYNALVDEMQILKQRDRMHSSKVNFYNENEDSFHNEKNLLKEIDNYKNTISDLNTNKDFLEKRLNEMEIILINKEESFKELQKENEFLMTELAYQKKAYMNLEKINSDLWNDIKKMKDERDDRTSSRKRWDDRTNGIPNDSNVMQENNTYRKNANGSIHEINPENHENIQDNFHYHREKDRKPQEPLEQKAFNKKDFMNIRQKNNSSVMKNLLSWDASDTANEISPKKRAKSPIIDEKTSPYLFEKRNANQNNNFFRK